MARAFMDLYLDEQIPGFPCNSSPRFSNTITTSAAGGESVNRNWLHPLHTFTLPNAIREHVQFEAIHDHWLLSGAREKVWPFRDPLDFASCPLTLPNVVPDFDGEDQFLGQGDGFTRRFDLQKVYERGGFTYTRPITLPVVDSLVILVNGVLPADVDGGHGGPYTFDVTRPGGVVTFTPALAANAAATWGGLFDVIVRFERDDSFDGIVQSYQVSGFSDLTFQEVRNC